MMLKQLYPLFGFVCLLTAPLQSDAFQLRASSEPYISGDSFRALANHICDETDTSFEPRNVKTGDIIFVKTDNLGQFFTEKHPYIANKYILISHNSDYGAPGDYAHFLDDATIIMWFGQNPTINNHPKFMPIPIGLANRYWPHGNIKIFDNIITQNSQGTLKRRLLAGINFRPGTNNGVRLPLYTHFNKQPFCINTESNDLATYLRTMQTVAFTLSPEGNGLDCHRTWEALLMGSTPVVKTSMLDPILQDLPVLIINNWADVTKEYLEARYNEMQKKEYNYDKIYFNYWRNLILSYKNK